MMHYYLTRKSGTRNSLFGLFFLLTGFHSHSQILEHRPEQLWLRQDSTTVSDSLPLHYVGNHPVLDLEKEAVAASLEDIASRSYGSLLVVLRPTVDSLSEEVLLRLGPVKIYRDRAEVSGRPVALPPLGADPAMVKVVYQARPHRLPLPPRITVSEEVELAEAIYYEDLLSPEEARVVESYLAMKYSINITENSDPEKRDYLNMNSTKAWHASSDGLYDREVLALGRLDQARFYQSQTYTSDAESIRASLEHEGMPGDTPTVAMGDGSLLILSRRKENKVPGGFCGGSAVEHPWKLRFQNWQSPAPHVYLTVDTVIDSISGTVLTDGSTSYPVQVSYPAGNRQTTFQIPVPSSLQPDHAFFLEWRLDTPCTPLAAGLPISCQQVGSANRVEITADSNALPVQVLLVHTGSRASLEVTQHQPTATIEGLEAGTYQLVVESSTGLLLEDKIFTFQECGEEAGHISDADSSGTADSTGAGARIADGGTLPWAFTDGPSQIIATDEEGEATGDNGANDDPTSFSGAPEETAEDLLGVPQGIVPYPNPGRRDQPVHFVFSELSGIAFTVYIYDSRGTLIRQERFTPQEGNTTYSCTFKTDGSYLVRFISPEFTQTKPVQIKSNMY